MSKLQKILLVLGIISVGIGGFVLTKYLTRNVIRVRGGVITVVEYETPPSEEPLSDDEPLTE
jgi:hypothetical protein